MSQRRRQVEVFHSSGNVFLDLGFSPAEAEDLQLRSDALIQLQELIKAQKKSQAEIGRLLGIDQPRVSDIKRGRIGHFSLETLLRYAQRATRCGIGVATS